MKLLDCQITVLDETPFDRDLDDVGEFVTVIIRDNIRNARSECYLSKETWESGILDELYNLRLREEG